MSVVIILGGGIMMLCMLCSGLMLCDVSYVFSYIVCVLVGKVCVSSGLWLSVVNVVCMLVVLW